MTETTITSEQISAAAAVIDEITDSIVDANATHEQKVRGIIELKAAERMLHALGFDYNSDSKLKTFVYRVEE